MSIKMEYLDNCGSKKLPYRKPKLRILRTVRKYLQPLDPAVLGVKLIVRFDLNPLLKMSEIVPEEATLYIPIH